MYVAVVIPKIIPGIVLGILSMIVLTVAIVVPESAAVKALAPEGVRAAIRDRATGVHGAFRLARDCRRETIPGYTPVRTV